MSISHSSSHMTFSPKKNEYFVTENLGPVSIHCDDAGCGKKVVLKAKVKYTDLGKREFKTTILTTIITLIWIATTVLITVIMMTLKKKTKKLQTWVGIDDIEEDKNEGYRDLCCDPSGHPCEEWKEQDLKSKSKR